MSDPGKIIYTLLTGDAGVTALAGTSIFAIRASEQTPLPYIIISKISDTRLTPIDATPGTYPRQARIQVSCFDVTAAGSKALADAVRVACDLKSGSIGGVQTISVLWDSDSPDGYDFDLNLYHQPVDFFVQYY